MQDKRKAEDKIIQLLKISKPVLNTELLVNEVEMRILSQERRVSFFDRFSAILFAWVNINWFRRIMVTASFVLISVFVWQQAAIIERLENLERRNYQPLQNNSFLIQTGVNSQSLLLNNERIDDLLEILSNDPVLWEEIKKRLPEEKLETKKQ